MDRSLGLVGSIVVVLFLLVARPGCNLDLENPVTVRDYYPPANAQNVPSENPYQQTSVGTTPSTIILGSFNIENFGPTKASRPDVMEKLVDIARKYDLLAIQELSNKDQSIIKNYVRLINSDGSRYSYIIGPRQGYTHGKEQYVYVFDTSKFRLTSKPYVAPNPNNSMPRPPLVASFECTQAPQGRGFSFTVLNVHTSPSQVQQEFHALESILPSIFANHPEEDDFIVLGDFNGSAKQIQKHRWLHNQLPLVRSTWATTVQSKKSLDNLVIDGRRTAEYRNQSGVLDLMLQYQLSEQQAKRISDHNPVWSVFSTVEVGERVAGTGQDQVR